MTTDVVNLDYICSLRWLMKKVPSLGEQEMEILRYVDGHEPLSVRDVAVHFEKEKKLARTTVLTVMERLRKKGFLSRARENGIFQYRTKLETNEVLSDKVSNFIEKTLGGSVSPLFAYFVSSSKLTAEELSQLKDMMAKMEHKKGGEDVG
ncbi:MAG: BlaI/MecI/CopY family transcriptional regulator [Bdellovibrionaceae bacterium]|nr:BlaI/MecI/CopY family transcriptional regulator [Pseudobdellovibrionaceae bacterium]